MTSPWQYRAVLAALILVAPILAACSPALPARTTLSASLPASDPTTAPTTSPSPSPVALTRDRAIAIAREAVPRRAAESVLEAEQGRYGDLGDRYAPVRISPSPSPDHLVWRINLGTVRGPLNADGTYVVIDATDGTVLQTVDWVS